MGTIHATVNLSRLEATGDYENMFLVDAGATDSMALSGKLTELGFKPLGKMSYELANGEIVEYDFTIAQIKILGDITSCRIIMLPDNAQPILGVTALESVGITVDPANRQLKRLAANP